MSKSTEEPVSSCIFIRCIVACKRIGCGSFDPIGYYDTRYKKHEYHGWTEPGFYIWAPERLKPPYHRMIGPFLTLEDAKKKYQELLKDYAYVA